MKAKHITFQDLIHLFKPTAVAFPGGGPTGSPSLNFSSTIFFFLFPLLYYQNAVVAERSKHQSIDREPPYWRFRMSSNPAAAVASFGKALYPHLPSLSEETLSRRVGPVYRRVTPYARKRTHFASRKEQGEIPMKWSASQTYGNGCMMSTPRGSP